MTESNSKYWLRRMEKIPPGISNTRLPRLCDDCGSALRKRHGFPVNKGRKIVCGGCVRRPANARS